MSCLLWHTPLPYGLAITSKYNSMMIPSQTIHLSWNLARIPFDSLEPNPQIYGPHRISSTVSPAEYAYPTWLQIHRNWDNTNISVKSPPSIYLETRPKVILRRKENMKRFSPHSTWSHSTRQITFKPKLGPHLRPSFKDVFNTEQKGFTDNARQLDTVINMGPVKVPPTERTPTQYAKNRLNELQQKFDKLESLGVFACPNDLGITVKYLNLSFLVKKANGNYHLVRAFAEVGRYSKPQPPQMPDVNSTLRQISQLAYIIITYLTMAFCQITLSRKSMKYCSVVTSLPRNIGIN